MRWTAAVLVVSCLSCATPPEAGTRRLNSLGMAMVRVPPGEFLMGSPLEEARRLSEEMARKGIRDWYPESPASEAPPRRTRITKGYWLGETEVTLGQFRRFVESTGYRTDAERDGKGADGKRGGKWATGPEFNWREMGYARAENQPVVNVSWNDAVAFCAWLSKAEGRRYRLPTEAEWEYACRAGTSTRYPWGDDASRLGEHAWTGANNRGDAQPVGLLRANAWGLHDMIGNVYEYTADVFEAKPYDPADAVDPKGPASGERRALRSGSWETAPMHPRSAFRGGAAPDHRNRRDGFRVLAEE